MPSIFSRLRKSLKIERLQCAASDEVSTLPSTQFAFRLFETLKPGDRNLANALQNIPRDVVPDMPDRFIAASTLACH